MMNATTLKPVNLQRLAYFVAVAQERSFTRTAALFGISQPALSRQIAILEGELGVALLERTAAGVVPTVIGRDVLIEAQHVLISAQRINQTVLESMQMQLGHLEIGTFPTHAAGVLLPAIQKWHERHPNITIHLSEFRTRYALREAVHLGAVDLGIGGSLAEWPGLQNVLGVNEFVLVLPAQDHALLEQPGPIPLEQLADRRWVLYNRSYGLSDVVDQIFTMAGMVRPDPVIETTQVESAARLAVAGLGPALLPKVNVPPELIAMSRPFSPKVVSQVCAIGRQRWSASAKAFLDILKENAWPAVSEDTSPVVLPSD